MHTYNEPLLLFDSDHNFIKRYNNIEEACIDTGIHVTDVYYESNAVLNIRNSRIWILPNSRNIENQFGNVECSLYDIYKNCYHIEFLNKIDEITNTILVLD